MTEATGVLEKPPVEKIPNTITKDVEAAIGRMTNKKLLREYALRSDQECDQEKYKFGSTAQLEAYKQPEYRRAAKRRLEELE